MLTMIITPATLITPEGYPQIYEKVKTLMLEIKEEYFGESPYLETMIISKFLEILTCVGRQRVNAHTVAGQQKENGANSRQKEYVEKFILVTDYINNHFAEDLSLEEWLPRQDSVSIIFPGCLSSIQILRFISI